MRWGGRDGSRPFRRPRLPRPFLPPIRSSPSIAAGHAGGLQAGLDGAASQSEPLTPGRTPCHPAHPGGSHSKGGSDGEHRIFVDHRGRPFGRNRNARQGRTRARARSRPPRRLHWLRSRALDIGAHLAQGCQEPAAQWGSSSRFRAGCGSPARSARRPGGKAAEDRSAGTTTGAASSSGWPVSATRPRCSPSPRRDVGAEGPQHALGMVARRLALLDHGGSARGCEPRKRHRRFHLGRGDRRLSYGDRAGIGTARAGAG